LYHIKYDKLFGEKALDLEILNQGGVPLKSGSVMLFITGVKVKLFNRFPKQKTKLLKFGIN
jgi:hypothetical protein